MIQENMHSNIMYLQSGAEYNNRKEALLKMGYSRFNKALKDDLMQFINGVNYYTENGTNPLQESSSP